MKHKTFKEYTVDKKAGIYPFTSLALEAEPGKYPFIKTCFGTHSLAEDKQNYSSLETSFGKHAKGKLTEQVSTTAGRITAAEQITDHGTSEESLNNIHDKNKLKKTDSLSRYARKSIDINNALHTKNVTAQFKHYTDRLDKSLNNASLHSDTHVFTGLRESPVKHFTSAGTAKVHLPAYTSTTTRYGTAEDFAKRTKLTPEQKLKHTALNSDAPTLNKNDEEDGQKHVLKIHLPAGTKAGSIIHFAQHREEHEILLHRGHNIEIHPHPTIDSNGTHTWHARIISHTPEKI